MNLETGVTEIRGIGPKKAQSLESMGIRTVRDLMYLFPRGYEDRSNTTDIADLDEFIPRVFKARVLRMRKNNYGARKSLLTLIVGDDSGTIEVVFFNARYLEKSFVTGEEYYFYGKLSYRNMTRQVVHPEHISVERAEAEGTATGILPVYPLTKGISQNEMRRWHSMLKDLYEQAEEYLNPEIVDRNKICRLSDAMSNIHFPKDRTSYAQAMYRLTFDELLVMQTGLQASRKSSRNSDGIAFTAEGEDEYIRSLPFPLTAAQERCVSEIMRDLEGPGVMNRLVQGDVGSGKTAVAEIAMFKCVRSGYQAVLMAPTEILAKQHYDGLKDSFAKHGITVGLLTGSMKAAEKSETLSGIADGSINIVVGTHAIIQPDVVFDNLGLVITDEQHRFGVNQRVKLKEKGSNPNVLVMTATPIPRTLAVVMYGDLDVSVIDELPPGRQQIKTQCLMKDSDRKKCYNFVEKQLAAGRQAYVVAPLIEESENLNVRSGRQVYMELKERFSEGNNLYSSDRESYNVAFIHGAMKQQEKDAIMECFSKGLIDVLVATVVIEVGINVPNSTVMVIENAERFGLAQLHQLRGRVGRGREQSYCFLIMGGRSEIALERGRVMEKSSDGFFIAEEDLRLRGPGEIFGTRQHGLPDLQLTDMSRHLKQMEAARTEARIILEDDPNLAKPVNSGLKERVTAMFGKDMTLTL